MFFVKGIILLAVLVLNTIVSFVKAARVVGRGYAECVYLEPKIYCYGGRLFRSDDLGRLALSSNIFNSLDLSESSDLSALQNRWESIPDVEPEENMNMAMVAVPDHNAIFMDGGAGDDDARGAIPKYNTTIYSIDDGQWTTDTPTGHLPMIVHTALLGPENTVYVWGGVHIPYSTGLQNPREFPLELYLFDFQTSSWSTGPAVSSMQLTRVACESALGSDGTSIYYVGGYFPTTPVYENRTAYNYEAAPMHQILIFDIDSQQWRTENTTGVTPTTRMFHSLTLKPSTGELILFGGVDPVSNLTSQYREDYSYLLDTDRMEWSALSISNAESNVTLSVTTIEGHSAILIGSELFIIFGFVPGRATSEVRVLDTDSWTWKSSIVGVQDAPPTTPHSEPNSGTSAGTIAGAVVGSIVGVAIIGSVVVFFWLRRRRQARKEVEIEPSNLDTPTEEQKYPEHDGPAAATSLIETTDGGTTQVSSNADPYHADASKFFGTEKPDGAQRTALTTIKPDGAQGTVITSVKPDGA